MAVAKGQIQPDGSYKYRCGQCGGSGQYAGRTCSHCYNLDLPKLLEEFELARGERYYAILKAILFLIGKDIIDEAKRITQAQGKFTPVDIAYLCLKFRFKRRFKPMAEWLEESQIIRAGTYENLKDMGFSVSDLLARAELKYGPLETEEEVDAYLKLNGYDPEALGHDIKQMIEEAQERNKYGKLGRHMWDI